MRRCHRSARYHCAVCIMPGEKDKGREENRADASSFTIAVASLDRRAGGAVSSRRHYSQRGKGERNVEAESYARKGVVAGRRP